MFAAVLLHLGSGVKKCAVELVRSWSRVGPVGERAGFLISWLHREVFLRFLVEFLLVPVALLLLVS